MRPLKHNRGFTLIELLVALAILGTVSVMAFGGLRSILTARNQTDESAARLAELQRAFSIIQRDIEQSINRPIRNEYGDISPALLGSKDDRNLTFTRTGYPNPIKQRRSSLMRVRYSLDDEDALIRENWSSLDGATDDQIRSVQLIHEVVDIHFAFLSADGKWAEEWPQQSMDGTALSLQPRAVDMTIELKDYGEINRIFRIPGFTEVPETSQAEK